MCSRSAARRKCSSSATATKYLRWRSSMVCGPVFSAGAASPGRRSLSAWPAPKWGCGQPPTFVFTLAGGRLPCSSFWGLAPMALCGRACNRAGLMHLRCLIVDDNASFREEIRGLLAEQGLDVVGGAGSAADAHRQIAELRPDVALIDIDLGGESGLELARELGGQPGE